MPKFTDAYEGNYSQFYSDCSDHDEMMSKIEDEYSEECETCNHDAVIKCKKCGGFACEKHSEGDLCLECFRETVKD
jgi:hypothetical protein